MSQREDVVLVEAADPELSIGVYSLPRDLTTKTWENDEQYYLTLLLGDTFKSVSEKRSALARQAVLSELQTMNAKLARHREMLEHPELRNQELTEEPISESQAQMDKAMRLAAANEKISAKKEEITIGARNETGLKTSVAEEADAGEVRRIFVIAGEGHFTDDVQKVLEHHPYIILRPTTLPPLTEEGFSRLKETMTPDERAQTKIAWLTARNARKTATVTATPLKS